MTSYFYLHNITCIQCVAGHMLPRTVPLVNKKDNTILVLVVC